MNSDVVVDRRNVDRRVRCYWKWFQNWLHPVSGTAIQHGRRFCRCKCNCYRSHGPTVGWSSNRDGSGGQNSALPSGSFGSPYRSGGKIVSRNASTASRSVCLSSRRDERTGSRSEAVWNDSVKRYPLSSTRMISSASSRSRYFRIVRVETSVRSASSRCDRRFSAVRSVWIIRPTALLGGCSGVAHGL